MERLDFDHWKGREVARLLALVETERRYYQEMVATLPVALAVLSADRFVASANRAFRQLFGLSSEDLRRKTIDQILPSNQLIEKIRDVHRENTRELGFLLEFGDKLLRIAILPSRGWEDEMVMETLLMVADVSDVRAKAAPMKAAPETAPVPPPDDSFPTHSLPAVLWRADATTLKFMEVRGGVENLLGYPAARWLESRDFFTERVHPDDRAATLAHYQAAIRGSSEASAEFRAITAAGETIWCRETVRVSEPGILSGVCTAITQRKRIEQQQVTAERIAALQSLSARLAHDLNNPLMIVTGYAEEMLHEMGPNDTRRGDVEQILTATQRMGGITSQLLEFTRKQAGAPRSVDLAAMLSGMTGSITRAAGDGVAIDLRPAPPVWASANRQQLEGIVIALVSPVREDAPPRTRVTIACDTVMVTELIGNAAAGPLQPGAYARLTLHDNGEGIGKETSHEVFESFLTKASTPAEKNAVAVAHAYGIVREWGGDIGFRGDPSHGSTFIIYLPLAQPEPPSTTPSPVASTEKPAPASAPAPEPRRETILVVDDEPGIRALVAKILRREGYIVLEAGNANEAMTVALIHGAPIQLLLTDVMLPDRSGREVAEKLRTATPGVKVLYMSGFTDDESVRTGNFPPGSRFLQKPFTLGALVGTVRTAFDS